MYLVDTSVWIDFLRGRPGAHVDFLIICWMTRWLPVYQM